MAINLGPSEGGVYTVNTAAIEDVKYSSGRSTIGPNWVKVSGKGKKSKKSSKKEMSKSQNSLFPLPKYREKEKALVLSPPAGRRPPSRPAPRPPTQGSPQGSPTKSTLTRGRYVNEEVGMMYRERSNSFNAAAIRQDLTGTGLRPRGNSSGQIHDQLPFSASLGFTSSRDGLNEQEEEIL